MHGGPREARRPPYSSEDLPRGGFGEHTHNRRGVGGFSAPSGTGQGLEGCTRLGRCTRSTGRDGPEAHRGPGMSRRGHAADTWGPTGWRRRRRHVAGAAIGSGTNREGASDDHAASDRRPRQQQQGHHHPTCTCGCGWWYYVQLRRYRYCRQLQFRSLGLGCCLLQPPQARSSSLRAHRPPVDNPEMRRGHPHPLVDRWYSQTRL